MRVLVCGGRDFTDRDSLFYYLDYINDTNIITSVIQGHARGADMFAFEWAVSKSIPCICVFADWKTYGKKAGFIRNSKMLEFNPDVVVAAPGGKGTNMMVSLAHRSSIPVEFICG